MKDIEELRRDLAGVFNDLRSGTIKPSEAAELNNCAGKMLNSLKVEIEYRSARKEVPSIAFIEGRNPPHLG